MRSLALPVSLQCFVALTLLLAVPCPTYAITYDLVPVGDAGNAADTTGYGAVAYDYQIGKYEVTIGQYTEFLNAVAQSDPNSLYNVGMTSDLAIAGIARVGSSGSFSYSLIGPFGDLQVPQATAASRPITYVSWFDAARFANWMSNGRPTGTQGATTTEDGAYAISGTSIAPAVNTVNPNTGSMPLYRIPTENEWYKAAYYMGSGTTSGYWTFATQSNIGPGNNLGSGTNEANFRRNGTHTIPQPTGGNHLTNVGAFSGSPSTYNTYDQSGNAYEWNDLLGTPGSLRGNRGGFWDDSAPELSSASRYPDVPSFEDHRTGFRLAAPVSVPEPSPSATIACSAALAALAVRRRFR